MDPKTGEPKLMPRGISNQTWGTLTPKQKSRAILMSEREADVMYLSLREYHGGSADQFITWIESVVHAGTVESSRVDDATDALVG